MGRANKIRVFCVAILTTLSFVATAQERIALVIGNADYETSPLTNPINDAYDMAQSLSNLGFQVNHVSNVNYDQMLQVVSDFGAQLHKDSVGLFYYAGHAAQYAGENYLFPVNNEHINNISELRTSAISSQSIQKVMVDSQSKINFIFLDACRDNPLSESPNIESGLAKTKGIASTDKSEFVKNEGYEEFETRGFGVKTKTITTAQGMLVSFSTSPGKTAADGTGNNSPFTKHLLTQINKPNVQVEMMIKAVQEGVLNETKTQMPWYESSIIGSFCFNVKNDGCAKTYVVDNPFLDGVEGIEKVELADGSHYIGQLQGNLMHGKGIMKFDDGRKYEGEFNNGKMHGEGLLTLEDGTEYAGGFVNGLQHGRGTLHWTNGASFDDEWIGGVRVYLSGNKPHYEGELKDGVYHGYGILTHPNGSKVEGNFVDGFLNGQAETLEPDGGRLLAEYTNGKANGKGELLFSTGEVYVGDFQNDVLTGLGVKTWPDGRHYEGGFLNGMLHGEGIFTWSTGDKYVGEFLNGMHHGKGVYTWPDGGVYEGFYKFDKKDGSGRQTWANGDSFEGMYKGGMRNGYGVYTYADGTQYKGDYRAGMQNGRGEIISIDGSILEAVFKAGEPVGSFFGSYTTANGERYEGEFKDRTFNGQGIMTYSNDDHYEGEFTDGKFNGQGIYTWSDGARYEGGFKDGNFSQGVYTYASGARELEVWENGTLISSEPL